MSLSGTDIFISYSRADRTVARHLARCFENEGFSVWWDAALHSGETFDEVIEKNLRAARAVVVLWSPRSVSSRWVRAEATLADRLGKLAPVIIEDCERPIIFQLTHTTDLTEWAGDSDDAIWRNFVEDLRRATGRDRDDAPPAAPDDTGPVRRVDGMAAAGRGLASNLLARDERRAAEAAAVAPAPVVVAPPPPKPAPQPVSEATQFFVRVDTVEDLDDEYHALEITSAGGRLEKRFVVSPTGLKIGRTPPSDIILADPMVSRAHCVVDLADDRLQVTDLRSTNGTFIDGERVEGCAFLEVGSVLRVGNVELKHELRRRADG